MGCITCAMLAPIDHIGRTTAPEVISQSELGTEAQIYMPQRTSRHRAVTSSGPRLQRPAHGDPANRQPVRPPWWLPVLTVLATIVGADAGGAEEGVPLGSYSRLRAGGEHCSGYSVDLGRAAGTIRGLFHACEGLAGDLPPGLIEPSSYDEKSGRLSFETRLTLG